MKQNKIAKEEREKFIRESDKRVALWSVAKQEAFYAAVKRIVGDGTQLPVNPYGHKVPNI